MKKIKTVGSVKDFVNKKEVIPETTQTKIIRIVDDNQFLFQAAGLAVGIIAASQFGLVDMAFAADKSAIDIQAEKIYYKIINIGKWFIVIKGAFDIIKNVTNGDFDSAKKNGLGYVLIYVILHALPWGFDQVDQAFKELRYR